MSLFSRLGDLFQLSYVTANRDTAVSYAEKKLGINNFFTFDATAPIVSRGESLDLSLRVAVANTGTHQFEIIEPVAGPTWIYTDGKDLDSQPLILHHIGIAVVGSFAVWQQTIKQLEEDGDEIVQISAADPDNEPQAMFAYVDNRQSLGHFTEYLWWAPSMNGTPTMPAIIQE